MLANLDQLAALHGFDPVAVEHAIQEKLANWRDLLIRHVAQARQILHKVLDGRLTFTPDRGAGGAVYYFEGRGRLEPILSGALAAIVPSKNSELKRWWPQRGSNPCFSLERAVS